MAEDVKLAKGTKTWKPEVSGTSGDQSSKPMALVAFDSQGVTSSSISGSVVSKSIIPRKTYATYETQHELEGAQRVHMSAKCVVGGTPTVEDWTECAQTHTQTDKSENSISASFTPFTWRI